MSDNPLMTLADAAAAWTVKPISPQLDWATRRAVLDWFGSMLPGCLEGPAVGLSAIMAAGRGAGQAISYVDGEVGHARHAALLNGTASHTAEYDDIFRDGGYHPGSPTISAALAVAQDQGRSHDDFQRAVIGGYEVGCRIAMALQPSHYRNWHITATVGTFGAAVSTAMLMGCNRDQIAHALAIATSFAGGHQENLQGEGQTKPLHCGHAADAGVLAGMAAAAGVTGSLNSLHAPHGYAAATSDSTGNWTTAFEGLGNWTPIERLTLKNHGCCGHIFPALDGMRALHAAHGFSANDIARLHIEGYGPTKSICDRMQVVTTRDARFSLQYCLSALLHVGKVRIGAFTPETMARDDIRAFMSKITVAEAEDLALAYPRARMARVHVTLRDGQSFSHFQQTRKGDPDDPLTDQDLSDKFDELAATVLEPAQSDALKYHILYNNTLLGALPQLLDRAKRMS
jgi:2-methylcitrate dehydratase PrpD